MTKQEKQFIQSELEEHYQAYHYYNLERQDGQINAIDCITDICNRKALLEDILRKLGYHDIIRTANKDGLEKATEYFNSRCIVVRVYLARVHKVDFVNSVEDIKYY